MESGEGLHIGIGQDHIHVCTWSLYVYVYVYVHFNFAHIRTCIRCVTLSSQGQLDCDKLCAHISPLNPSPVRYSEELLRLARYIQYILCPVLWFV